MATYAVDSIRQPMTATGIVEAVMEWDEMPDGRRRPSDRQARNDATGTPLWGVEVLYTQVSFGRESTSTAKVTVGAEQQPVPGRLMPVGFVALSVDHRVNKAGGFVEVWSAEALMDPGKPSSKFTGAQSGQASSPSQSPSGSSGSAAA